MMMMMLMMMMMMMMMRLLVLLSLNTRNDPKMALLCSIQPCMVKGAGGPSPFSSFEAA